MRIKLCGVLLIAALAADTQPIRAQSNATDYSTLKLADWVIQHTDTVDYALKDYAGKPALLLTRKGGTPSSANIAYPKNLDFTNGTIELDIASPNGQYGFVGLAFHIKDNSHYETLYFRPGSSGTVYAVQYMPKKRPEFDWWHYEDTTWQATATLPQTEWFHVKVTVKGREMKVYLNDQTKPVMTRKDLDPTLPHGSVGFWFGNCPAGAYKNLKIKKTS